MKIFKITTSNRSIYYLKACPVIDHNIAMQMLGDIRSGDIELCQRLIDRFPRADAPINGIPLTELDADMINDLFFEGGVIEQLLEIPAQEKTPPSVKNPPLKNTGNPIMDIFARLSVAIGIDQAWLLINKLSFEELIDWQESYNESSRPIEERRQEYIQKLWHEQVAASPEDYYDQLIESRANRN